MSEKMSADLVGRLRRRAAISGTDVNGTPMPTSVLLNSAADHIATLQREAEVMRLALNYALPIVEKYAHTQGDNAAFHAKITEPLRVALNGSPQATSQTGSDGERK